MDNLVSIVVTCYNHEKYIVECLNSIFNQTYKSIELLVINDGSTDNSGSLIEESLKGSPYKKTEYVAQTNAGICVTRNLGLDWLNGEFVLFVDSDNYLEPNYVEEMIKVAQGDSKDIVYADLINAETQEVFLKAQNFDLKSYLKNNYIDNCSLIRTKKIGPNRYDLELNRKKLVDYDFLLSLVLNAKAVPCKTDKTFLHYRVLENSISRAGEHKSEKFYYDVYLYILSKYVVDYPELTIEAIKQNIFTLEDRLEDLISHLSDVSELVHNQEANILDLKTQKDELMYQFDSVSKQLDENKNHYEAIISTLENDKYLILNSKSYRIGNLFVKPFSYVNKFRNFPKHIRPILGRIKRTLQRQLKKVNSLKRYFWRVIRSHQRNKNVYENPKRILVYVIYENQDRLQEYKRIFLEALSTIVDRTLIVVNGNLNQQDIQSLSKYGEVVSRDNSGYDTAAFRYGIQYLGKDKLKNYDELLLINDTNVGPFSNIEEIFSKMARRKLDFWGISYGEEQNDFTGYNKYGFIPIHLQSYFLVIEKSLLNYDGFYEYWEDLKDTNSRNKAIGKHETVFTWHFANQGFKHGALTENNEDSPMYIHPLTMVKEGVPFVKYTAFANYNNDKFAWQGLLRETEVPALLEYIEKETNYPMVVINDIMKQVKNYQPKKHILIIDGVENAIPQLTRYRVLNKKEQLESLGYDVWLVNLSGFQMGYAEHASHVIIYRAGYTPQMGELIRLARKYNKPVLYDIDDLVIDTKYTDQLTYTQNLNISGKAAYDKGVKSYGEMLRLCDGAITTTKKLKEELMNYHSKVLLNRNLASRELIDISSLYVKSYSNKEKAVKIGYFSGSITHNENFELIKPAILKILSEFENVELHLAGHLDIPKEFSSFKKQIHVHPFVDWKELPKLIGSIDINLAPLVRSIFNEAKSEIKWIEAALVNVPTVASNIGAFIEMIDNHETGILVNDDEWYASLKKMVESKVLREYIATNARRKVMQECTILYHNDELTNFLRRKYSEDN